MLLGLLPVGGYAAAEGSTSELSGVKIEYVMCQDMPLRDGKGDINNYKEYSDRSWTYIETDVTGIFTAGPS